MDIEIRLDDLSGPLTQALIAAHLAGMHDSSPAESVHALDLDRLRHPSITFWSAWDGDQLAGIGALKMLDERNAPEQRAEIKSMRVDESYLGTGIGRRMLRHIVAVARGRGCTSVWLETGSTVEFVPARALYASEGFVECGPFGDYVHDPYSVFMTLDLTRAGV
ncbi:GNAT family N-acetyltransferase [Microbacterium sp. BWT-B31]|uniref:GNAT family N-acetyltransferase n=1 Tax=Microbacterium sp. BWT-B31 TaxID=3232072 RepID=UPI0035296D9D